MNQLEYRALLAVDIAASAGRGNVALDHIRTALAKALHAAFEQSGIESTACRHDDLGDGMRVIAPAGVRKYRLIHPLIHELAVQLRAHNRNASSRTAVRVRAALHAGEVDVGTPGVNTGGPLEVLARLLDAPPLRTALAESPEAVSTALLISQHFHEETVRHGYPGIDPEAFHKVTFTTKEHTADAWLHLAPASVSPSPRPRKTSRPTPGRSTMVNKASGHGTVYATQHGTQHVHLTEQQPEDPES